jgi:hypothetical protein
LEEEQCPSILHSLPSSDHTLHASHPPATALRRALISQKFSKSAHEPRTKPFYIIYLFLSIFVENKTARIRAAKMFLYFYITNTAAFNGKIIEIII